MSSEETVSVVGSEVMPLDYGSMDSESNPSPSSSEKTMEGVRGDEVVRVGGNEMVGVEGDSVPITVVEVEGRIERGYDVEADIVEEATGVEERVCFASRDHWMPVYAHYLFVGLRFPIPELLVGLLLDYGIGLTQLVPNAMRGGSRKDKGWYYFTPRVANRESRALFMAGPSSIKGWKEKFFFVDDTEMRRKKWGSWWGRGGDLLNIMDLTNAQCIEAAELYGPSAISEAEMDNFLNTAGGVAIPKKLRKKSKTSTKQVDEGRAGKEKKKKVMEEEERGSEVPQFVPQPLLVELDPKLRQLEEGVEVRAPGKGKGPVPPLAFQSSLFETKNMTGARRFINTTFPESASWVNGLAQEFMDSVKECSLLQRQCDQLQREKEELEKKNKELQEALNEVVPTVKQLEQERAKEITLMKDAFMELKENVQVLVHNGMKEHINNFINSSSFDNIVNLYRLPTAIIAFTDCRKKVKAEYPEVDITKITFGEQEEGVEENGESMSANFRPQIKLKWDHDADGRVVFPPQFYFEFVVVEEEGVEVEEDEVEAGVEGAKVDENLLTQGTPRGGVQQNQPALEVEIHPVPSDDEQPPLPDEQQPTKPPLPVEQESV
ncbi:hypothetical protein SLEP1_g45917 [Rubroshorea leprosula]|uniref:Transposase (Putative), gypsy type n=1 Tax=Rubroshorea leprosula TaxID=152421 RepID=A0AAV5LMY4_9ROSI|nr:hypothetical protein SLEP1_g45917 [Rubroshorea leprosula]